MLYIYDHNAYDHNLSIHSNLMQYYRALLDEGRLYQKTAELTAVFNVGALIICFHSHPFD